MQSFVVPNRSCNTRDDSVVVCVLHVECQRAACHRTSNSNAQAPGDKGWSRRYFVYYIVRTSRGFIRVGFCVGGGAGGCCGVLWCAVWHGLRTCARF